ncbi:MAG: gliding motility-associated C-terminal domain-containing protein [Ferruginibacter sp.]|nr:gliding motility-associated C-terminal domain-containing protein [Ferruginibacter sp.]
MNESWRFVPSAGSSLFRSVGLYDLAGNLVATGDTFRINKTTLEVSFPNVCISGTKSYIIRSQYEQINNPGSFVYGTDTVNVNVVEAVQVNAGSNQSIFKGQNVQLNASVSGANNYLWTSNPLDPSLIPTSIVNPIVSPSVTTTYTLTATNASGCKASSDVTITVLSNCINLTNSFTPNSDGINDLWKVFDAFDCLKKVKVAVYNRYGSKVYESREYKNTWDGRYEGKPVPDGTYYAVVEYTLVSGKVIVSRTDLTILR